MKQGGLLLMISMLMLNSSILYAATPKFSIVPVNGSVTSLLLPSNFTESVSYQVTNNTHLTRTLTMVPITGTNQVLANGGCSNPFTLAPQQSCTLTLNIIGSQIPQSGVKGGPVICKTMGPGDNRPDPFLCSQPNQANILDISVTTAGQFAYIANQLGNSVSFCQLNPATGLLTHCAITATGLIGVEGVGFNPAGTLFYSANLDGNTISVCQLNAATGALSSCIDAGGSGFNQPDAIAFSPDGSIFYTSNVIGGVTACLVNPVTGQLSNCVNNTNPTFSAASDMVLNTSGTLAYVSNRGSSTVSVCQVSGQVLDSCNDLSGSLFNAPEGISLSLSGLHAYITNAGDGKVILCDVRQDGSGLLDHCSVTPGEFHGTGNLAFNQTGSFAYVPNQLINDVFVCQVSPVDGSLSACVASRGTELNGPSGIVIH